MHGANQTRRHGKGEANVIRISYSYGVWGVARLVKRFSITWPGTGRATRFSPGTLALPSSTQLHVNPGKIWWPIPPKSFWGINPGKTWWPTPKKSFGRPIPANHLLPDTPLSRRIVWHGSRPVVLSA